MVSFQEKLKRAGFFFLPLLPLHVGVMSASAADRLSSTRTDDGIVISFPNGQKARLESSRGLLGPLSNPQSQVPLTNKEGTLVAVNEQPETKTSILHLYLKGKNGLYVEIKNAQGIIKGLQPRGAVTDFIRANRISSAKGGLINIELQLQSAESEKYFPSGVTLNTRTGQIFVPEGGD